MRPATRPAPALRSGRTTPGPDAIAPGGSEARPAALPPLTANAWLRYDVIRRILDRLEPGSSVLEVGCGGGALGARIAARFRYVAYEPDPLSFHLARSRLAGRGRVINEFLPVQPAGSFDVVAAFEVLEHLEDDEGSLRRWRRWLKPGGVLLLSVPANPQRFGPWDRHAGHVRRYSAEQVRSVLVAAGYRAPEVWSVGGPLGYLLEFARNRLARPRGGASLAARTAESGRLLQPGEGLEWLTRWGTAPFRLLQRPFLKSPFGTGLVALARR